MTIKSKDLAKLLGVSTATVSLVINNKSGISPQLRKKLINDINELGYGEMLTAGKKPAAAQKTESPKKKHTIVYAIFTSNDTDSNSTFFPPVLEGVEMQARDEGYDVQVIHIGDCLKCSLVSCMKPDECLGVIVQANEITDDIYNTLCETGLPFIALDRYSFARNLSAACVNNEDGIFTAVNYLKELGHKNLGYVASHRSTLSLVERRRCYHQALREFELEDREAFRFFVDNSKNNASADLFAQWKKMDHLPTAILCENDIIAVQVLKAARKMKIQVPEQMSIIGFDDRSIAEWTDPPLTTVRTNRHLMGRQGVMLLLNLVKMRRAGFKSLPYKVNIGVQLIVRDTSCAPEAELITLK